MTNDRLRLENLSIRGFLGIKDLSIRRLGRVTLLAGRNGVGKTTVLDAVRVYAARGAFPALYQLLRRREEVSADTDREGAFIPRRVRTLPWTGRRNHRHLNRIE